MADKRISDTQEINAILEEARKNREPKTAQKLPEQERKPVQVKKTVIQSNDPDEGFAQDEEFAPKKNFAAGKPGIKNTAAGQDPAPAYERKPIQVNKTFVPSSDPDDDYVIDEEFAPKKVNSSVKNQADPSGQKTVSKKKPIQISKKIVPSDDPDDSFVMDEPIAPKEAPVKKSSSGRKPSRFAEKKAAENKKPAEEKAPVPEKNPTAEKTPAPEKNSAAEKAPAFEKKPVNTAKAAVPARNPGKGTPGSRRPADNGTVDISAAGTKRGKNQANQAKKPPRPAEQKPQKKKKSKVGLVIALVIIGVILLAGAGGVTWYLLSGSSTMADNITVSGVSLAGMTYDEAKKALAPVETSLADTIKVEVKGPDNKVLTFGKDDFRYTFNTDEILKEAQEYSEQKGIKSGEQTYTVTMKVDDSSCKEVAEKAAKEFNREAKNARVATYDSEGDGTFTYEDDVLGVSVKVDELTKSLSAGIKDKTTASVDAPYEEVKAKYTKEFLQKNITQLSSFTTTSTNSSNGNHNMATSLDACDGSIIEPDAVWSFNECTGDSNQTSNGYLPAGVIVEGRHETGVGGGICQSSTTIYNATLLCGMEVEERSCHYYKSTYVDAGRDATVDYGNLDLKMSNPFDTQLFMKCYMEGVVLHCEMYGIPQADFDDIEITTETTSSFSNGYKVAAERHYLKDDKEVRVEELPNSTYYTSAPSSGNSSSNSNDDDDDDDDDDDGGDNSGGDNSGGDNGGGDNGGGNNGGGDNGGGDNGGGDNGGGDNGGGDNGGGDNGGGEG